MKLRMIAEFNISNNMTFEDMIEYLNKHDQHTLKTWFTCDIKLGVLTLIFNNESLFNNPFNFDVEYLEKILVNSDQFKNKFQNGVNFQNYQTKQI
jgi:hypothetical protein